MWIFPNFSGDASDVNISYFVIYVFYCFYSVICSFNFRAVLSAYLAWRRCPVHYCIALIAILLLLSLSKFKHNDDDDDDDDDTHTAARMSSGKQRHNSREVTGRYIRQVRVDSRRPRRCRRTEWIVEHCHWHRRPWWPVAGRFVVPADQRHDTRVAGAEWATVRGQSAPMSPAPSRCRSSRLDATRSLPTITQSVTGAFLGFADGGGRNEARRAEMRGPWAELRGSYGRDARPVGPTAGVGSWGGGSEPPPHQLGGMGGAL